MNTFTKRKTGRVIKNDRWKIIRKELKKGWNGNNRVRKKK